MVPSGIKRNSERPFRTRKLENGTVVVEDAYEGRYYYSGGPADGIQINGISVETPASKKISDGER